MVIRECHGKRNPDQGGKEDGGNLLSWLDFTTSPERLMVWLSHLSKQSIKVTEDLSILSGSDKWIAWLMDRNPKNCKRPKSFPVKAFITYRTI